MRDTLDVIEANAEACRKGWPATQNEFIENAKKWVTENSPDAEFVDPTHVTLPECMRILVESWGSGDALKDGDMLFGCTVVFGDAFKWERRA